MRAFIKAEEIRNYIKDGDILFTCGFGLASYAEEAAVELEKSFLETGHPCNLTLYWAAGVGNFKDKGLHHFAHEGMTKRMVGGHYGVGGPEVAKLVMEEKVEAYNLPQGILSTMGRNIAAHRPGVISKVGLRTFVDPRVEGGRVNVSAKENIVEVINFDGEEWLYYKSPKINVALIRGSVADEKGNMTLHREGILVETLSIAQAVKASGGIVIAQVERIAKSGTLHPRDVCVPGISIDYIFTSKPEHHLQTMSTYFDPAYSGDIKVPVDSFKPLALDERKIICRRAAMELKPGATVNLGIGMPEGVSAIAAEEKVDHLMALTTEAGGVGGVPAPGMDFGHSMNTEAMLEQPYQFDFYDGGGIDVAFLGLAQTDKKGNVNVSKFNKRTAGCGGFINITQNSKKVVFCGTFTAGKLAIAVKDGRVVIQSEGTTKKFLEGVEQITFSGPYAASVEQPVLYITERAVFKLVPEGLELIEIAPGLNIEKDILQHMDFTPVMKNVQTMPKEIFLPEWGKLGALLSKGEEK